MDKKKVSCPVGFVLNTGLLILSLEGIIENNLAVALASVLLLTFSKVKTLQS